MKKIARRNNGLLTFPKLNQPGTRKGESTWSLWIVLGQHTQLHACLALKTLNLLLDTLGLQGVMLMIIP